MGTPVRWEYVLVVRPDGAKCAVELYRKQVGYSTRFLWQKASQPTTMTAAEVDQVLQELYVGVLTLMEATA